MVHELIKNITHLWCCQTVRKPNNRLRMDKTGLHMDIFGNTVMQAVIL
jgi:hypothetical protein